MEWRSMMTPLNKVEGLEVEKFELRLLIKCCNG